MSKDKVPGSFKSKATYKSDVHENPRVKEIPGGSNDTSDELYEYTNQSFPGYIGRDPMLNRDEAKHVKHKPLPGR